MYEYFKGILAEKAENHVVLDVQGIGYKLATPCNLCHKLPDTGTYVCLYSSWVVREMSQTLYGFLTHEMRDLFELLLTLSGIGPKIALAIVGHFSLAELDETVRLANSMALSEVPGIGKKTAERLLLDLKGKLKVSQISTNLKLPSKAHDALQALLNLGYPAKHAQLAIQKALDELPEEHDLSSLIAAALKK